MALSNQASMQAKLKPVPPPKPTSQHNLKPLKQSLTDAQPKGSSSDVILTTHARSSVGPFVPGLRGRPVSEANAKAKGEKSTNLQCSAKPLDKHIPLSISDSFSKFLLDKGGSVRSKKPTLIGESSFRFSNAPEPVQLYVGRTKPPLLPKPRSGHFSLQIPPKPPIPKRPFLQTEKRFQESGTQTNASSRKTTFVNKDAEVATSDVSRSSFANLFHFERAAGKDGCENPVRPPRSPKNKPFTGLPFDAVDKLPVLSAKQKNFSLPQSARLGEPVWTLQKCSYEVICDLDKVFSQRVAQEKSCSLDRNVRLHSEDNLSSIPGSYGVGAKIPLPPPRRLKKKSDSEANFLSPGKANTPVYAVVNYELKKNRRSLIVTDVEADNPKDNHDSLDVTVAAVPQIETGIQEGVFNENSPGNLCERQLNNVGTAEEVEKSSCSEVIGKDGTCKPETPSCEKIAIDVIRDCDDRNMGSKELTSSSSVKMELCDYDSSTVEDSDLKECDFSHSIRSEAEVVTSTESAVCNESFDRNCEMEVSSHSKLEESKPMVEGLCSELLSKDCSPKKMDDDSSRPFLHSDGCDLESQSTTEFSEAVDKKTDNVLDSPESDKTDREHSFSTSPNQNEKNASTTSGQSRCSCKIFNLTLKTDCQLRDNLNKISSESDCSFCAIENKKSGSKDDLECKISHTSSLPLKSKLNVSQGRCSEASRRQSWSDGQKKENGASSMAVSGKHSKRNSSISFWCDEGELSSGVLGDESSFEEVLTDKGEVSPVCRRFTALFSSFGKSSRKPHKQKEKTGKSISRFYCKTQDEDMHIKQGICAAQGKDLCISPEALDSLSSSRLENESVEGDDQRLVIPNVESASKLCTNMNSLDMESKTGELGSESHLSEGSDENAHSESENEETGHDEDTSLPHTSLSASQRRDKKAFYIAKELMTSEKVFVDALRLLCIHFRDAVLRAGVEEKNEIIPEAHLWKILNNLPQLLRFNEDLLHDLENRINNWSSIQKIADVIVRKGPFLKLYTSYFQNFETQVQFLDDNCERNPRFARVVRDFEASPLCKKLALRHYMLKPIQRVPQYRLLLESYLAHLDPTSFEYEHTLIALSIVRDVADHANRSMKQGDAFSKLLQLQSLLKNYVIVKPGRSFLKEGELQKLCRKGMQSRYFILLNDCLLYAVYERHGYLKVNYELPLNGMKVEIPVAEDYTNEFSVISIARSFTLSASSAEERTEWVNALTKAIQEHTSRQQSFLQVLAQDISKESKSEPFQLGTVAPVWIQDCRVTMCQCCIAEFTVTFRRHHCRACGKVVCGICSANKAPLQYMKFQAARVCNECYKSLSEDYVANQKNIQEAIQREIHSADFAETAEAFKAIKASFKKLVPTTGRKAQKFVPQRLKEVCANDTGSQMSGWLHWCCKKSWKRNWFVLKEQVLYVYKASEDVVALESIPILGYKLESPKEDTVESVVTFSLTHQGKTSMQFQADNVHSSKRWIQAMKEAIVLK